MIKTCKREGCEKEFEYDADKIRCKKEFCCNRCRKLANAQNMSKIYHDRVKEKKERIFMVLIASINNKKKYDKELNRLSNKCEALSRQLIKLRDPYCVCGCGKPSTDWAHGVSRRCEQFKFHPINTFGMNHECHLAIDHNSKYKNEKMDELQKKRLTVEEYNEWLNIQSQSFFPFTPTYSFYLNTIDQLDLEIAKVQL